METFARNALRISLAGAGIVVLGASYVGQASADEAPSRTADTTTDSASPSASGTTSSSDSSSASDSTGDADAVSPLAVPSLPTVPSPEYLLAPSSLDTFVLPTVSDMVAPPEL
jgi:hypothetical protein